MGYDFTKKFIDKFAMPRFRATDAGVRKKYGTIVRAIEISNREYQHRYDKFKANRNMKEPPSSGRIFAGYLVVRNLDSENEYETWIPDHAFEEIYEPIE